MWKFFLHKIKQTLPTERIPRIRLSLAAIYAFSAWNLVIVTFYYSIKDGLPITTEAKERLAEKMKKDNIDVEFVELKGIVINTSKDKENEMNVVET